MVRRREVLASIGLGVAGVGSAAAVLDGQAESSGNETSGNETSTPVNESERCDFSDVDTVSRRDDLDPDFEVYRDEDPNFSL